VYTSRESKVLQHGIQIQEQEQEDSTSDVGTDSLGNTADKSLMSATTGGGGSTA
jgi:hypothetical protein